MVFAGSTTIFCTQTSGCAGGRGAATPRTAIPTATPTAPSPHLYRFLGAPRTVRGFVVLSYERKGQDPQVIEGFLAAERPDRLRISTHLGLIQAFELTARDDSFWVAIPHFQALLAGRKGEVRSAPLDPARLAQGLFLLPCGAESVMVEEQRTDSLGTLLLGRDADGEFELRLGRDDLPRRLVRRRAGGGAAFLTIELDRYVGVPGGRYPRAIRWRDLANGQALSLEFDDAKLDTQLEQRRFGRPADRSLKVIPWTSWEAVFDSEP